MNVFDLGGAYKVLTFMADSKTETDLEEIYDAKQRLLDIWEHKLNMCRDYLEVLRLDHYKITEYHDTDPAVRHIRYTCEDIERYTEGSAIWIRFLGYLSELDRIEKSLPTFEGVDLVTGKRKFSPCIKP